MSDPNMAGEAGYYPSMVGRSMLHLNTHPLTFRALVVSFKPHKG